jgi:hypothetical protein
MPRVRFEPTTPVFERAKRFHALDSTAMTVGYRELIQINIYTTLVCHSLSNKKKSTTHLIT